MNAKDFSKRNYDYCGLSLFLVRLPLTRGTQVEVSPDFGLFISCLTMHFTCDIQFQLKVKLSTDIVRVYKLYTQCLHRRVNNKNLQKIFPLYIFYFHLLTFTLLYRGVYGSDPKRTLAETMFQSSGTMEEDQSGCFEAIPAWTFRSFVSKLLSGGSESLRETVLSASGRGRQHHGRWLTWPVRDPTDHRSPTSSDFQDLDSTTPAKCHRTSDGHRGQKINNKPFQLVWHRRTLIIILCELFTEKRSSLQSLPSVKQIKYSS